MTIWSWQSVAVAACLLLGGAWTGLGLLGEAGVLWSLAQTTGWDGQSIGIVFIVGVLMLPGVLLLGFGRWAWKRLTPQAPLADLGDRPLAASLAWDATGAAIGCWIGCMAGAVLLGMLVQETGGRFPNPLYSLLVAALGAAGIALGLRRAAARW